MITSIFAVDPKRIPESIVSLTQLTESSKSHPVPSEVITEIAKEKLVEKGQQFTLIALGNLSFLLRDYQNAYKIFNKALKKECEPYTQYRLFSLLKNVCEHLGLEVERKRYETKLSFASLNNPYPLDSKEFTWELPTNTILFHRAIFNIEKNAPSISLDMLKKALDMHPSYEIKSLIYFFLCLLEHQQQKFLRAKFWLEKLEALEISESQKPFLSLLQSIIYKNTVKILEKENSFFSQNYLYLGNTLFLTSPMNASSYYAFVIEHVTNLDDLSTAINNHLALQIDSETFEQMATEVFITSPSSTACFGTIAIGINIISHLHLKQKATEENLLQRISCVKDWSATLAFHPINRNKLQNLIGNLEGCVLFEKNEFQQAISIFKECINHTNSQDPWFLSTLYNNLGVSYYFSQSYDSSEKAFQKANEFLQTTNVLETSHYFLHAKLCTRTGKKNSAYQSFSPFFIENTVFFCNELSLPINL